MMQKPTLGGSGMTVDPVKALNDGSEALDRLLKIAREMKGSLAFLKSMPSIAFIKMEKVIEQIDITVRAVDEAIKQFLTLTLDPKQIEAHPDAVKNLAVSQLKPMIENNRGHCSTIQGIRDQYLRGWLDKQRKDHQKETQRIDRIFQELADADRTLFGRLARIADYMEATGESAVEAALAKNRNKAKRIVQDAASKLLKLRKPLNKAQLEIISIKNGFIDAMKLSAAGAK
jgi:hypothetical protein